jgi:hypothetical protein
MAAQPPGVPAIGLSSRALGSVDPSPTQRRSRPIVAARRQRQAVHLPQHPVLRRCQDVGEPRLGGVPAAASIAAMTSAKPWAEGILSRQSIHVLLRNPRPPPCPAAYSPRNPRGSPAWPADPDLLRAEWPHSPAPARGPVRAAIPRQRRKREPRVVCRMVVCDRRAPMPTIGAMAVPKSRQPRYAAASPPSVWRRGGGIHHGPSQRQRRRSSDTRHVRRCRQRAGTCAAAPSLQPT